MKVLAMDMGGTFIKYAVCNVSPKGDIKFLYKDRFRTSYEDVVHGATVVENMAKEAAQIIKKHKEIECICASIGGVVDCDNYMVLGSEHKFKGYNNVSVKEIFAKHCKLPLYIINDVKAGGLGELKYGALKNDQYSDACFIAIGTGVASVSIINGKLYLGNSWAAGECGPMVVNGHYFEPHWTLPSVIRRCKEIDKSIETAEECLEKAKKNRFIKNIIDTWFVGIVDAVLNHVYILNPKYIVFGGKISEHKYFNLKVFKNLMLKTCRQPPINSVNDVKLIKAKLGNDAALYGVASLAINRDYKIERIKESKR